MKALIIAAGNGTRLQPYARGRHKSLLSLFGLKIIERIILTAKETGISEFVIVTGYEGKSIRALLKNGEKYGVSITYIENTQWEKANGISTLRAKKFFHKHFVLLMSDHIFSADSLRGIQRLSLKAEESALAVDRNLNSADDLSDTTKVVVKKNRIVSLNKNLTEYNAFDTGMFVCSPYVFKALARSTKRDKNSLSDGMRILVKEGKLRAFNIRDNFWADCDTLGDLKIAEKKLIKSLTKQADGIVSKVLNRKISGLITRLFLVKTNITPNTITVFTLLLAVATAWLLAKGVYPWIFIGGLLILFVSIIDGCDGEIARLKFLKSEWGAFFDAVVDKYVDTAIIAGMAYGYWTATQNIIILPISIFVVLALILDGYMPNKYKVLTNKKLRWMRIPIKRDLRLLILALGAITNQVLPSLLILLLLLNYMVVARLMSAKSLLANSIGKF